MSTMSTMSTMTFTVRTASMLTITITMRMLARG
jgi:hypothetical protein